MKLCELCIHQQASGICALSRPIPQKMRCTDFTPGMERFFAVPADYTGREQLKQMAVFFGLTGKELRRVLILDGTLSTGVGEGPQLIHPHARLLSQEI